MKRQPNPIGAKYNDYILTKHADEASILEFASGNYGTHMNRGYDVSHMLSFYAPQCFSITKAGQHVHPLYQCRDSQLQDFRWRVEP